MRISVLSFLDLELGIFAITPHNSSYFWSQFYCMINKSQKFISCNADIVFPIVVNYKREIFFCTVVLLLLGDVIDIKVGVGIFNCF